MSYCRVRCFLRVVLLLNLDYTKERVTYETDRIIFFLYRHSPYVRLASPFEGLPDLLAVVPKAPYHHNMLEDCHRSW